MRVVQINAVYKYSSTGRSTYEMHKEFQKRGIESYVFWGTVNISNEEDPHVIQVGNTVDHKVHGALTAVLGEHCRGSIIATHKLCRELDKIKPDVVHLRNLHSNYINFTILMNYLKKNNIPTLISLHDCWIFTGGCMFYSAHGCTGWLSGCSNCAKGYGKIISPQAQLKRKISLLADMKRFGVIGVSRWVADEARKSLLSNYAIIDYIYNWMDLSRFHSVDTTEIRHKNEWEGKKIAVLVSNSWKPAVKGAKDVIMLATQMPDIQFVIIGRDLEDYSFPDNVKCIAHTDSVDELIQYYSAADVFVNPSRQETFGKVTAEALCCGTPVVAYSNTATTELVPDKCGILCADGDVSQFVSAIRHILNNGKEAYSSFCRTFAEKNFSLEVAVDKHLAFYDRLVGEIYNET